MKWRKKVCDFYVKFYGSYVSNAIAILIRPHVANTINVPINHQPSDLVFLSIDWSTTQDRYGQWFRGWVHSGEQGLVCSGS